MSATESVVEAAARRRVGTVLEGKYALEALLGYGGMAAVYRATHRNGHRVAVKILHPELSISEDVRARFLREGYVANKVDHAGAVRVIDDDVAEDGSVFLVMELLEGSTLEHRWQMAGRRLGVDEVVAWTVKLLDVLAAAHARGIVHRDIKPENLFVTERGELKVLDFGIARLREGASSNATRTGRLMGTPAFVPPEQALGYTQDIDARSDLYAVGATMFTLLAGRFVHDEARTAEEMLVFAATRPAPKLLDFAPDCPPWVAAVVDRALAFDKNARWPDALAMQQALAGASMAMGSLATMLASKPPPKLAAVAAVTPAQRTDAGVANTTDAGAPHVARSRWPIAAGAFVAIACAGVAVFAFSHATTPPTHAGTTSATAPPAASLEPLPVHERLAPLELTTASAPETAPPPAHSASARPRVLASPPPSSTAKPHVSATASAAPPGDMFHP